MRKIGFSACLALVIFCCAACGGSGSSQHNMRIVSLNVPVELDNSNFVRIEFSAEMLPQDSGGIQVMLPPLPDDVTVSVTRGMLYSLVDGSYLSLGTRTLDVPADEQNLYWLPSTYGRTRSNASVSVSGANTLTQKCHIESVADLAGAGE